jgi:hypothetical protein
MQKRPITKKRYLFTKNRKGPFPRPGLKYAYQKTEVSMAYFTRKDDKKIYNMFIDGQWFFSDEREAVPVINPTDESVVAYVQKGTEEDAEAALVAAEKAQPEWAAMPPPTEGGDPLPFYRALYGAPGGDCQSDYGRAGEAAVRGPYGGGRNGVLYPLRL